MPRYHDPRRPTRRPPGLAGAAACAVFLVALGVRLLWPGWFFELTAVSVSVGLVVVARAWLRPAGGRTAAG